MKIRIKNLQQQTHEIEIDSGRTILDLKNEVFRQLGAPYDVQNQTLIYAGVILQNEQTIKNYNIDEKKFLVCLVRTNPAEPDVNPPPPAEQQVLTRAPHYVQTIMELGFSETQAREALSASMNNPDRAVDFLISGTIPVEPTPNDGNNNVTEAFEHIRRQPQFTQIRNLIRQRPELLDEVLRRIGASNPQIMTIINENREAFMEMMNRDDEETVDRNTLTIEVTQEDKEAIDRLKALGFSEDLVIQAYFACEKNENMAANLLLSSLNEE